MHSSRSSLLFLLWFQLFQEEKENCFNQKLSILGFTWTPDSLKSLILWKGSEWHSTNGFPFFHLTEQLVCLVIRLRIEQEKSKQLLMFRWQNGLPESWSILWMASVNIHKRSGNYGLQFRITLFQVWDSRISLLSDPWN